MRSRLLLTSLGIAFSFAVPVIAYAGVPFFGPIIPTEYNVCPASWGLLVTVINNIISLLLTLAIVFVAPLMIAYSGFLFVVNPVNAGGISQAKAILLHTVVGLVIAFAGWLIVDAIMAVLYSPTTVGKTWSQLITSGGIPPCLPQAGALPTQGLNQAPSTPSITVAPGPSVSASGLNISTAVQYLDANALNASSGRCALYVRQALAAGGLTSFNTNHPTNAADYGPYLTNAKFTVVDSNGYSPKAGDVVVFQPTATSAAGHIQMYDGSRWVSDFKQNNFIPGTGYQGDPYVIYRP